MSLTPVYFDVATASTWLGPGFSLTIIKKALRETKLPYAKVGRRISIKGSDLIAWAEAQRTAPTPGGRARHSDGTFVAKGRS